MNSSPSIYDFELTDASGQKTSLAAFRGQVLLIVNTASQCSFTGQYKGLEDLQRKYHTQGFSVLGFPCNQFGGQEPGDVEQIRIFCETSFGVHFPIFDKIDVNGPNSHPLFTYLKSEAPGLLGSMAIKWNFTKFLLTREGKVTQRFAPRTQPEAISSKIHALLKR